ncbi:hypothetical protein [Streptomyces goshikiensis]|uniref:hypothetical protein n=1 Tax=Streptomyces goshikiensis TaxID=1942 RepID=UPI00365A2129
MPGEANHHKGADGARRVKRLLDGTTWVAQSWTNEDPAMARMVTFNWPHGEEREFSFDVGGMFSGGDSFLVESKNYDTIGDQGAAFDDFLAKSYCARLLHSRIASRFLWFTWHPFRVTTWSTLHSPESINTALLLPRNRTRLFDTEDEGAAKSKIDQDVVREISDRTHVWVVNEMQENLLIGRDDLGMIIAKRIERGEK